MAKTAPTVVNVSANGCVPSVNSLDTEVFPCYVVLRIALLGEVLGGKGSLISISKLKVYSFFFLSIKKERKPLYKHNKSFHQESVY